MILIFPAAWLLIAMMVAIILWPVLSKLSKRLWRGLLVFLAAVLMPAAIIGGYLFSGTWSEQSAWENVQRQNEKAQHAVAELEQFMRGHGDELDGWILLARSATQINDLELAEKAWAEAFRLTDGKQLDILLGYGEVLSMRAQGRMPVTAQALFLDALEIHPDHAQVLWYAGMVAFQNQAYDLAVQRWSNMLEQADSLDADFIALAQEMLDEARIRAAQDGEKGSIFPAIEVSIELAVAAMEQWQEMPQSRLFLTLREAGVLGQGLPLAARTVSLALLKSKEPVVIEPRHWIDANREKPGAGPWEIMALLSFSGLADKQPGDWYGKILVSGPDFQAQQLVIDQRWLDDNSGNDQP